MEKLSYEMAMMILDELDCVALTDSTGRYIYQNKGWYDRRRKNGENEEAPYPWDILKQSRVQEVIRTKKRVIGHIMDSGGVPIGVNYYPIFKDGEFAGVLIHTFMTGMTSAKYFADKVEQLSRELDEVREANRRLSRASYGIANIIGESDAIVSLKEEIARVARTSSNVLIEGETGVGKELVAHAIHDLSRRRRARFVRVNCAAIPENLMETEFFGYAEGSFTGAKKGGKMGKFELASGGSLFLDEVNLLPDVMQPKLLRVLQEHEIDRVGGTETVPIDTRLIAATNVRLMDLVRNNKFRQDLYYRLNVITIRIPPLRERKEDIPILVRALLAKLNFQMQMEISGVTPGVMELFMSYDWPGNIRELQNVLEHAMNFADDTIELRHVQDYMTQMSLGTEYTRPETAYTARLETLAGGREDAERTMIERAIEECGGNRKAAADKLGIARSTFYRKLQKYGL